MCDKIVAFQRTCHVLMHMTKKELGWKGTQGIQNTGLEDSKGNIM
jgi:hypothetical protein